MQNFNPFGEERLQIFLFPGACCIAKMEFSRGCQVFCQVWSNPSTFLVEIRRSTKTKMKEREKHAPFNSCDWASLLHRIKFYHVDHMRHPKLFSVSLRRLCCLIKGSRLCWNWEYRRGNEKHGQQQTSVDFYKETWMETDVLFSACYGQLCLLYHMLSPSVIYVVNIISFFRWRNWGISIRLGHTRTDVRRFRWLCPIPAGRL